MSLILHKASYSKTPIRSVAQLCKALEVDEALLRDIASRATTLYRRVKPKPGSKRETFDALPQLKLIHERIKTQLLLKVVFPDYLTGSLKGRDYKANAAMHAGQRVVICEDVKGFFPSVVANKVYDIWQGFFGFSPEVAHLLTQLTTKAGVLPQGAIPSSYLANLVFWRSEPLVQAKLKASGVAYSRYVDDMSMSSKQYLSRPQKSSVIAMVYGMLRSVGLSAGRNKHEVFNGNKPMIVTKLQVNGDGPSLPKKKRANVRAALFQLERMVADGQPTAEQLVSMSKAAQRVGQLNRFHKGKGARSKVRLASIRERIENGGITVQTGTSMPAKALDTGTDSTPPWD